MGRETHYKCSNCGTVLDSLLPGQKCPTCGETDFKPIIEDTHPVIPPSPPSPPPRPRPRPHPPAPPPPDPEPAPWSEPIRPPVSEVHEPDAASPTNSVVSALGKALKILWRWLGRTARYVTYLYRRNPYRFRRVLRTIAIIVVSFIAISWIVRTVGNIRLPLLGRSSQRAASAMAQTRAVVNTPSGVYMRTAPIKRHETENIKNQTEIKRLLNGSAVTVLGFRSYDGAEWAQVRDSTGKVGYVFKSYIKIIQ